MASNRTRAILVTGGRGFIGRHLVRHLVDAQNAVIISADVAPIPRTGADNNLIEVKVDIRDRELLNDIFSRFSIDRVFDLASITQVGLSVGEYVPNFEMTRSLVDCVKKFGVDKYIFFSTQLVFRKEGILPASDKDYNPVDAYGESKIESECWIRSNLASDNWLILRPTYIWGEGHQRFRDGFLYRLAKGQMMLPTSANVLRYYGYVATICDQAATLAARPLAELLSKAFYLSDAPIPMRRFCEYFITALGRGRVWPVPAFALRTLGRIGDAADTLGIRIPIRGLQANEMTRCYPIPLDATLAITQRPTDYAQAAASVVAWALSDPEFRRRLGHP